MAKRDYYEILGANRDDDAAELKKSFRQKAMRLHPDRNPGDPKAEQQFKELNEAYDVLRDEQKRAAYDQFGHAAFEGAAAGGGGPGGGGFGFEFGQGFADIFDEMFGDFMGGGRRGGGATSGRGSDLRYNMEIALEDAFKGKKSTIRVPTSVICAGCKGSGGAKGSRPAACGSCQGRGKVRAQQGFFTIERTCPTCGGGGQVIANPCTACGGAGRVRKDKTLSVSIPAGVEEGTRIRLAGEGEAGVRGGTPGDLYIFLNISPHRFFQRDGANIYCRVPIPMTTAALGGTVEVPTVDGGRARVTVPAGTQGGDQFRLRGKGMSVLRAKGRGDMFIEVAVETPVNLDKRQKELLRELKQSSRNHPTSPEADGFFTKVRDLWEDLKE